MVALDRKTYRKRYHKYECNWCNFVVWDDENRMKIHLLKTHGVTGKFFKGYKTIITHRIPLNE